MIFNEIIGPAHQRRPDIKPTADPPTGSGVEVIVSGIPKERETKSRRRLCSQLATDNRHQIRTDTELRISECDLLAKDADAPRHILGEPSTQRDISTGSLFEIGKIIRHTAITVHLERRQRIIEIGITEGDGPKTSALP